MLEAVIPMSQARRDRVLGWDKNTKILILKSRKVESLKDAFQLRSFWEEAVCC